MALTRRPIQLPDYERIYRLICGVLDTRANTPRSCIFFAAVGAAVLELVYKLPANPKAGAAVFGLSAATGVITTFGKIEGDCLISTPEHFHCWVECNGFAIDFMAPLFEQSMRSSGNILTIPPKMFQRPLAEMASSPHEISREGDFFLSHNPDLSLDAFRDFAKQGQTRDLANVVLHWYRRPPKPLPAGMGMYDDLGNSHKLLLKGPPLVGAW